MPVVLRNPFRRNAPPLLHTSTEPTLRRLSSSSGDGSDSGTGTTEELNKTSPPASKSTGAISIKASDETNSYKMSVVNDSGVYLPPSPPAEKKAFWKRPEPTTSAKNRPPVTPVDDAFTISKESFDSYRRSFDISARSPIADGTASARVSMDQGRPTRASMDVRPARSSFDIRPSMSRLSLDSGRPRGSIDSRSPRLPPTVKDVEEPKEGEFEDIKLHDDPRPKRSLFHPFGGEASGALSKSALFTRKEPVITTTHESELARIDSQRVLGN